MARILLVEDDSALSEIIRFYLTKGERPYDVTWAQTAQEAIEAAPKGFDLILLDIMLPDLDGLSLCTRLRRILYCPIIFISSLDDDDTIVRALHLGGDDYLAKPFKCPVLLAKIEAHLRRAQGGMLPPEILEAGELRLSVNDHTVEKNGEAIYLSPTEFQILLFFMTNRGRVVDLEEVYQAVWQKPSLGDVRTVPVHVGNLRKKIEDSPAEPRYIKTVKRIGYRFDGGE